VLVEASSQIYNTKYLKLII